MLKTLAPQIFDIQAIEKCGEIYCHSFAKFTICCTFCNMKDFTFEDFKLHVQNVHLANNLHLNETFTPETNEYLEVNIKSEITIDDTAIGPDQLQEEVCHNDMEHTYDNAADSESGDSEGEFISETEGPENVLKENSDDENARTSDIALVNLFNEKISSNPNYKLSLSQCYECEGIFDTPAMLVAHIKQIHINPSGCQMPKQYDHEEKLCTECNVTLPNKSYFIYHVCRMHKGFKCYFCDKRFQLPHERSSHERTAHRDLNRKTPNEKKTFMCEFEGCGKVFQSNCYLERHIGVHSTDPTYVCDICLKKFHSPYRVRRHRRIHTNPKKYQCESCDYKCREKQKMIIHTRRHTGEKPYPCKICDKRFISSSALSEHRVTHSSSRSHVCEICDAAYVRKRSLALHIAKKHSDYVPD